MSFLIDGRNRLEACRRAGVQLRFDVLSECDPLDIIIQQKVTHRHMTKGQVAMAVVKMRLLESNTVEDESALARKVKVNRTTGERNQLLVHLPGPPNAPMQTYRCSTNQARRP